MAGGSNAASPLPHLVRQLVGRAAHGEQEVAEATACGSHLPSSATPAEDVCGDPEAHYGGDTYLDAEEGNAGGTVPSVCLSHLGQNNDETRVGSETTSPGSGAQAIRGRSTSPGTCCERGGREEAAREFVMLADAPAGVCAIRGCEIAPGASRASGDGGDGDDGGRSARERRPTSPTFVERDAKRPRSAGGAGVSTPALRMAALRQRVARRGAAGSSRDCQAGEQGATATVVIGRCAQLVASAPGSVQEGVRLEEEEGALASGGSRRATRAATSRSCT